MRKTLKFCYQDNIYEISIEKLETLWYIIAKKAKELYGFTPLYNDWDRKLFHNFSKSLFRDKNKDYIRASITCHPSGYEVFFEKRA